MSDSWNNVKAVCCKPWLVLPTVYSDALSYGEQLDKFCYSLNKLIENNNILPDFIADKIKEYISSGAIGEVVQEILANYILNVKYPPKGITPAVGDGSADDTEAIQGCIDYASENGGVVYFPYGSYLTQPLTMKSGVSLFGFDRYSTKVVLKGGATKALLNGNGNNFSVCNLTLDGNSGIQVNDVNVVDMTGSNLMFNDLIIQDGYKLFNFVGDGHLQLSNIVFGNAVENCFTVDGNVIVQTKNLLFTALSKVGGVSVVNIRANGGNYDFNSVAKCDTCMLINGNDNKVVAMIGGAAEDYVDTGEHNNVEIVGHSQKEYYSKKYELNTNEREIDVDGNDSVHIDGASTLNVGGIRTEAYAGDKTEKVTGNYTGDFGNAHYKTSSPSWLVDFPNKTVDLAYIGVPYNVKMEGVKGDGKTDDTKALQNSICNHAGKCIYIPAGVYIISDTIILPNDTFIIGDGIETIIEAAQDFTGIMMKSQHYGDDTSTYDFTFKLCNITLDGGYANYITYEKKKPNINTQHGICIKGEGFEFDKLVVRNCGGDGIRLVNNPNRSLSSYENAGTSYIINSKVMFNAYSGIVCDGCVDWVIHNCDIHSNSRNATNSGNNLSMLSGNCKISDSHFFKLYGAVVPAASIYIAEKSGSVQVINCHIEGATTPVSLYGNRCFFQNCRIYSSFGVCDIRIDADYCSFIGCEFFQQVSDNVPGNYPEWLGAVVFEKNAGQKNNGLSFEGCSLQQTRFTHSTVNMGFQNRIILTGNAPQLGDVDYSKAIYSIVGYMGQGGTVQESTPLGFPIAGSAGIFDITGDINIISTYNFVNSYTNGNLILMPPKLGLLCLLMNNTSSSITVKAPTGCTIAGGAEVTIEAHSINIFLGNTDTLWKKFSLS